MNSDYNFDAQLIDSACHAILPKMQSIENDRITVRKRITRFWIIALFVLAAVAAYLYMRQKYDAQMWIVGGVAIVGAIIFYCVYVSSPLSSFKNRFKDEVIRSLIVAFLPDATYNPDEHVEMTEYHQSFLYKTHYDRFSGENYVSGVIDKTKIRFSQLHTEYKTVTRTKNGGTQTQWHTIFNGVFMVADANKNFSGQTFILPDIGERRFGAIGKWFQKNIGDSRGQLVYMEDAAFEKRFAVYATDPVEARYLITPKMQERLLSLSKHVGGQVCASFVNGKLFLAIGKSSGLFNVDTTLSLLSVDTLKYYTQDITDMLSIVHILDLNTRIWGKG